MWISLRGGVLLAEAVADPAFASPYHAFVWWFASGFLAGLLFHLCGLALAAFRWLFDLRPGG